MNSHSEPSATSVLNKIESNKEVVRCFINSALSEADPQTAAALLSDHYIQHNPIIPDGKLGFLNYFKKLRERFPAVRGDIKRLVADGDTVVVHMHAVREPGDNGLAIVDIFRLESGLIAEHWEVRQPVVQSELHSNSMI